MLSGAALPGLRVVRDVLTVSLFAGAVVQDYRLSPYDPSSRLHGFYAGAQLATDVWYQPTAKIMAAVNGSLVSIGPTGYLRVALGYRLFDAALVGPETAMLWCANFQQLEVGAHLTGLYFQPWRPSFQIGANNFEQLSCRRCIQRTRMLLGINEMCVDVIFDDLGHETGHRSSHPGDEMQDLFAPRFAV
jgi:hypothetical protein